MYQFLFAKLEKRDPKNTILLVVELNSASFPLPILNRDKFFFYR
jgi:hypothetical protein